MATHYPSDQNRMIYPDDEREVIIELSNGVVTTGQYFSNGNVWRIDGEYTHEVVAWQDLPKSITKRLGKHEGQDQAHSLTRQSPG